MLGRGTTHEQGQGRGEGQGQETKSDEGQDDEEEVDEPEDYRVYCSAQETSRFGEEGHEAHSDREAREEEDAGHAHVCTGQPHSRDEGGCSDDLYGRGRRRWRR